MIRRQEDYPSIVITGIGLVASVGLNRERVWRAVQSGVSGVRRMRGLPSIPDGMLLGATVEEFADCENHSLRVGELCLHAAKEAMFDSGVDLSQVDRGRFGCAVSGHMGDLDGVPDLHRPEGPVDQPATPWHERWLPNTSCMRVANRWNLRGPRLCHSTACASGLIDFLAAVRSVQDGQCDLALAGSGEAIHPLFAAGFHKMKVLADHDDPAQACRPFDIDRNGFVMGEGAAMFVIERLEHAVDRGAKIYAEVVAGKTLADAHHVTGLDADSGALPRLITETLRRADLAPQDIAYINAHGTGTEQNDVMEARAIRRAMGFHADRAWVSSCKSMLGHLVNAAGSVELAITALALRDGFAPPTVNLVRPDPRCDIDCIPLVGRRSRFQHALKLSVAFGGHLAAVVLRRWNEEKTGFAYPSALDAA